MKKMLSYALVALAISGLAACKGSKAEMITAKWKISDMTDGREIPADKKAIVDSMMSEMKKTAYFEFQKEGKMEVSMMGRVQKMTWKLSVDGKKLITKEEGRDKEESLTVAELTSSKLVLSSDEGANKIKITLVK